MDNAAARLAAILEVLSKQSAYNPAAQAWSKVLDVDTPVDLLVQLARVAELVQTVHQQIEDLPEEEERELLVAALEPLSGMVAEFNKIGHSETRKEDFDRFVTPVVIRALHACSRAFRRAGFREATIDDDGVMKLLGEVQEWMSAVASDANLPTNFKMFVLARLRDVEAALLGYRVGGFNQVEAAVLALAGTALVYEPTNRSFVKRVGDLWRHLMSFAQGTQAIAAAAEGGAKAIDAITHLTK